jgi:hypothetical protein
MTGLRARPLDETTWPDFAALVERHNGVWGGCWCMAFHAKGDGQNRSEKERRVREGRAHAALVYDGATCVGWCQFGSPDELPRIKRRRAYLERLGGGTVESYPEDGRAARFPRRSYTTRRWRCSSATGSSAPAASASTTGS